MPGETRFGTREQEYSRYACTIREHNGGLIHVGAKLGSPLSWYSSPRLRLLCCLALPAPTITAISGSDHIYSYREIGGSIPNRFVTIPSSVICESGTEAMVLMVDHGIHLLETSRSSRL